MPHDEVEIKRPRVVIAIAVIDGLLLLPVLFGNADRIIKLYGFIPLHPTLLTFFSAMFLHVGFWHYAGNMWFLWAFGRKIEATLGHWAFAGAFLLCGIGATCLYWLTALHSPMPCVGASGAISGVAGLYFLIYPRDRFDLHIYLGWWRVKTFESNARMAVAAWIGEQLVLAFLTVFVRVSTVAFWAHVGGFVTGVGLAGLYCSRVPEQERPSIKVIEIPTEDMVAQPNGLVGLNLSGPDYSEPREASLRR